MEKEHKAKCVTIDNIISLVSSGRFVKNKIWFGGCSAVFVFEIPASALAAFFFFFSLKFFKFLTQFLFSKSFTNNNKNSPLFFWSWFRWLYLFRTFLKCSLHFSNHIAIHFWVCNSHRFVVEWESCSAFFFFVIVNSYSWNKIFSKFISFTLHCA